MPTAAHLLRLARDAAPTDGPASADSELLQRYVSARDEAAFAELVRRDGPLVLRACRHILGEAGADDAFQATFLLLVRSARRLTRPGSLAGWLHAAAVRVATNARRGEERRRKRERSRAIPSASPDDLTWREVREVLDVEIAALPESYRLPVVLCHIQELGYEEAARRAGCPVGALRGRLERGKDQLRKRLARYGLPLAAPALVLGAPPPVAAALVEATLGVARVGMSGQVPPALAGLMPSMGRLRMVLFLTSVVAVGAVIGAVSLPNETQKANSSQSTKPVETEPGARKDLFGDPLPDGVVMRLGTTRFRATITGFGIAPDGTVVTVSRHADVLVWPPRADHPKVLARLSIPGSDVFDPHAAVSPDGRFIAANTVDKKVRVWERSANGFKDGPTFETGTTRFMRFSPDGTRLAVVAGGINVCDVNTGKSRKLDGSPDNVEYVESLTFSGDGKRLAVTATSREVDLWDVESGKRLARFPVAKMLYTGIALDRTGARLVVRASTRLTDSVLFVDSTTGARIEKLAGPQNLHCLWADFAPDGKTVLLGDRTGVTWWDPAAGKLIRRFEGMAHSWAGGHNLPARFSPDGMVLVGTSTRMLLRWDATTGKPVLLEAHDSGHHSNVTGVGVSPDGRWIATGGYDAHVKVWDAKTGRVVSSFPAGWMLGLRNLEFSPDGRFVYGSSTDDGDVTKWDATTGREVVHFKFSPNTTKRGSLVAYRLSHDGKTVTAVSGPSSSADATLLCRWDAETGKSLLEKPIKGNQFHMHGGLFSPDGNWLATANSLFSVDVGETGNTLPKGVFSLFDPGEFSADSRLLAKLIHTRIGEEVQRRLVVFEVASGAILVEIPLTTNGKFAFHPAGSTLVFAGPKSMTFFDLTTGKSFAERKAEPDPDMPNESFARVIRYIPDGTRLITGHADTTALIWDAPAKPKVAKPLDEKKRAAAWDALVGADGKRAWTAVWALADDPGAAGFLREKVKPAEPLPAKEFDSLLANLNAEDFTVRKEAAETLRLAGERAVGLLRGSLKRDLSAEQRDAIGRLLDAWRSREQVRVVRAVAALELSGGAEAQTVLEKLAAGGADAITTREAKQALERIGRR